MKWLKAIKRSPEKVLDQALGGYELPSFPVFVTKALAELRSHNGSLKAVADILMRDPGMSVRVVSTANSGAYAVRHRVESVQQAVTLLGRTEVELLLLATAVRGALSTRAPRGFDRSGFWKTAGVRASVARLLAKRFEPRHVSQAFTVGLLQDMALPMLASAKGDAYLGLLKADGEGRSLVALEREAFGWDHAVIGGALCKRWQFPDELTAAIIGHHEAETVSAGLSLVVRAVSELRGNDRESETVNMAVELVAQETGTGRDEVLELFVQGFELGAALGGILAR